MDKESLEKMYLEENMSMQKIADALGVKINRIIYRLKKYNIKRRDNHLCHLTSIIPKEELIPLLNKKKSHKEIATLYKCNRSTVRNMIKYYNIPFIRSSIIIPDLTKKSELSYILGVLLGDGSIGYDRNVRLKVISRDFALSFKKALDAIGLRASIWENEPKKERESLVYEVVGTSKLFVDWYRKLTLDDIFIYLKEDKKYILEFLRGFYESEGYYNIKRGIIDISNTNLELVELVTKLLNDISMTHKIYPQTDKRSNRKKSYHIIILKREMSDNFLNLISPVTKTPGYYIDRFNLNNISKLIPNLPENTLREFTNI